MEEIDIPPFFICPISMDIMKDPVTVETGITYDRESIEKWIYSSKNKTCPVTKQVLSGNIDDLTPNHTLRRLIQAWCTLNASYGIERIPTPKPPINRSQIHKLIRDASTSTHLQMKCLQTLRSIASESNTNRRYLESAGAVEFLSSIIINNNNNVNNPSSKDSTEVLEGHQDLTSACDEAVSILYNLQLSDEGLKKLTLASEGQFFTALTRVLKSGNYESRAYAIMLLKSMCDFADPMLLVNLSKDFFDEIVKVLDDQISYQSSKAALQLLGQVSPWGRNRIKAVKSGAVRVLIELLLHAPEKRVAEMILITMDTLCGCAEGRSEFLNHDGALAIVSKKILRVSQVASGKAVRILYSVSKYSSTPSVLQDMLQYGVVAKLCLVLQVECSDKIKEKAKEILRLHARAWKNSPCVPMNLASFYPS